MNRLVDTTQTADEPNAVFVIVEAGSPEHDNQVLLLMGELAERDDEVAAPGAGPGCYGNVYSGCAWTTAPRADRLAEYGEPHWPLRLLTVAQAVDFAGRAQARQVITASIDALDAMVELYTEHRDIGGSEDDAPGIRRWIDVFRRQIAAVLSDHLSSQEPRWWERLVELDALMAERDEFLPHKITYI
jgi:hypothetical protein